MESQGLPQWSMEKSNWWPHLQLNQSSSSFICFIYWGCAKAFVQYKDSAMEKKKRKKIEMENSNGPIIICHSVSKDVTEIFFSEIFLWQCLYNHFLSFKGMQWKETYFWVHKWVFSWVPLLSKESVLGELPQPLHAPASLFFNGDYTLFGGSI